MPLKVKRFIKRTLLLLRKILFQFISIFTFFLRTKTLDKSKVEKVLIFAQKRIGDTIVSIPAFRAIKENFPKSQITVFSISYIKDILDRIGDIDNIVTYDKEFSLFQRAKLAKNLSTNRFDLAVDLTCDYTLESALLAFLSRAKYRVGYNTYGRGFLFHKSVPHEKESIHITDEILNIAKSINLDTDNKNLRISASAEAQEAVRQDLQENNIESEDVLVGIHPGGHYPTQRWLTDRFAKLADRLIERYHVKIILLGGPKELELINLMKKNMQNTPIIFLNQPVRNLLGLIQSCRLLICNNSGPLHLATALGIPTVSFMGPTIPKRWWPQGKDHVVIRKDLSCMPCNEGFCKLKTQDCMKLITVEEALEAIDKILPNI